MDIPLRDPASTTSRVDGGSNSRDRLHYWVSENADIQIMRDAHAARADSPVLGFDHCPHKVLPDLPAPASRLRPPSVTLSPLPTPHPVAPVAPVPHRRSSSQVSSSLGLSRRPSLARNTSLPLLSETGPDPSSQSGGQSYSRSITSSLPLGSYRNAVYFDSEQLSSRLDEWVSSSTTKMVHDVQEDPESGEYYATQFEADSPLVHSMTPTSVQGPPPNTPMTAYYRTPYASSSQVYIGRTTPVPLPEDNILVDTTSSSSRPSADDACTTPIPHGKLLSMPSSPSSSVSSSPFNERETTTTPRTSPNNSPTSIDSIQAPRTLHSKPSLGLLSPKSSLSSIALGYQNHLSTPAPSKLLSPPVTASRWSLTSSVAEEGGKDKSKKEKRKARKRLVSFISKISGNAANRDLREFSSADQEKPFNRERSNTNTSIHGGVLPPVALKSSPKPPPLKLASPKASQSVANLRSPTLTLSSKPSLASLSIPYSPTRSSPTSTTPATATFSPSFSSPISAHFPPPSPVDNSFASRLSATASMTTISTNTASPQMPNTPILSDVQLASPPLKNALSAPVLSPALEGPALLRRGTSFGWGMNGSDYASSRRVSVMNSDDDDDSDLEDDAEYYTREFSFLRKDPIEEERKARLSVIADMLDRDLGTPVQQETKIAASVPRKRPAPLVMSGTVKPEGLKSLVPSRTSPVSAMKPSNTSRASSPAQRRSVSSSSPFSPTISTPTPVPSKNSFKNFAARIRNSNVVSTPHRQLSTVRVGKETDSKRKSIVNLIPNAARKNAKRRLVISGVGDGQKEVSALKEWCYSLGEVRSMVKTKSTDGQVGQGKGSDVWIIDFKKSTVAESACQMQDKLKINGAGTIRISWEAPKSKIRFDMSNVGWMP